MTDLRDRKTLIVLFLAWRFPNKPVSVPLVISTLQQYTVVTQEIFTGPVNLLRDIHETSELQQQVPVGQRIKHRCKNWEDIDVKCAALCFPSLRERNDIK